MFVVVREGYQFQGIVGVFSSWHHAKSAAEEYARKEPDTYHGFSVFLYLVNKAVPIRQHGSVRTSPLYESVRVGYLTAKPSDYSMQGKGWVWTVNMIDNRPGIEQTDKATQFAYDLLNGDPMALDMLEDMTAGRVR